MAAEGEEESTAISNKPGPGSEPRIKERQTREDPVGYPCIWLIAIFAGGVWLVEYLGQGQDGAITVGPTHR